MDAGLKVINPLLQVNGVAFVVKQALLVKAIRDPVRAHQLHAMAVPLTALKHVDELLLRHLELLGDVVDH